MDGYVFLDIARTGEENMQIDRQLLAAAERLQCAFVRLYRWSPATLSLGHFQADIDRTQAHARSADLPLVIRESGGGAIVHDREWTYSIAMPVGKNKIGAATELYDLVHASLVDGLRKAGWDASIYTKPCQADSQAVAARQSASSDLASSESASPELGLARSTGLAGCGVSGSTTSAANKHAFLCFQRRSCGDIVCEGYKVVGSAQRRFGSSVLQHGSILLDTSPHAPELVGLAHLPRRLYFNGSNQIGPIRESRIQETSIQQAMSQQPATQQPACSEAVIQETVLQETVTRFVADPPNHLELLGPTVLSWIVAPLVRSMNLTLTETSPEEIGQWLAPTVRLPTLSGVASTDRVISPPGSAP